jgi:hypothetical protein
MIEALNGMLLEMLAAVARKDYEDRRRRHMQGPAKAAVMHVRFSFEIERKDYRPTVVRWSIPLRTPKRELRTRPQGMLLLYGQEIMRT